MPHHPLDYVEITVDDLAAATAFYTAAFGWELNDYGPGYAGIRDATGDGEVGGLAVGPRAPGRGALPLVRSTDLEGSRTAVLAAGGTIVDEPYDYPGGRRFIAADPSGNAVGVYQVTEA